MSRVEAVVETLMPDLVADLKRLASIPSIAFDGFDHGPVHEAYELVVELLRGAGSSRSSGWTCRTRRRS